MKNISGIVFIWYPSNGNIGHASLQIGNTYSHDKYVSWWPEGTAKPFRKEKCRETWFYLGDTFQKGKHSTLQTDISDEGEKAHVTYVLKEDFFSEDLMLQEWNKIEKKQDAHYILLSKNCSHVVSRVLAAGYSSRNSIFKSLTKSWHITTPRDIAGKLNHLGAQNQVIKSSAVSCPKRKHRIGSVLLGMR